MSKRLRGDDSSQNQLEKSTKEDNDDVQQKRQKVKRRSAKSSRIPWLRRLYTDLWILVLSCLNVQELCRVSRVARDVLTLVKMPRCWVHNKLVISAASMRPTHPFYKRMKWEQLSQEIFKGQLNIGVSHLSLFHNIPTVIFDTIKMDSNHLFWGEPFIRMRDLCIRKLNFNNRTDMVTKFFQFLSTLTNLTSLQIGRIENSWSMYLAHGCHGLIRYLPVHLTRLKIWFESDFVCSTFWRNLPNLRQLEFCQDTELGVSRHSQDLTNDAFVCMLGQLESLSLGTNGFEFFTLKRILTEHHQNYPTSSTQPSLPNLKTLKFNHLYRMSNTASESVFTQVAEIAPNLTSLDIQHSQNRGTFFPEYALLDLTTSRVDETRIIRELLNGFHSQLKHCRINFHALGSTWEAIFYKEQKKGDLLPSWHCGVNRKVE